MRKNTDKENKKSTKIDLYKNIDELLEEKKSIVIAVEGSSASGKTTLAKELKKHYNCNVIPMDDFFLRPEQRTKERLEEPGGNVDRERFYEEVVTPLVRGEIVEYRPFDCCTFTLKNAVKMYPNRLTIIEGAYSTHPELGKYYDLSVFLDVDSDLQKERILKRNGQEKAEIFFYVWIPMEHKYFEMMSVKERCDLVLPVL